MTVAAYPLQWPPGWPRTSPQLLRRSLFKTNYERSVKKLREELRLLGASDVVVSADMPVARSTGVPYADAARRKIQDAGVAVYFTLKDEPQVMARDAYLTIHENMMSIAHVIEHMRGISRHGGDYMMKQAFTGFAALPAPSKPKRPWRTVFGLDPNGLATPAMVEGLYKIILKNVHPDHGGTSEAFIELQEARKEALLELGAK